MYAYGLWFGRRADRLAVTPLRDELLSVPDAVRAGWSGGRAAAPGPSDAWPRSPRTGLPTIHALTVGVPREYRRKGKELVAISFFAADDHAADPRPGIAELNEGKRVSSSTTDPVLADCARHLAAKHPEPAALRAELWGRSHFGGTTFCCQGMPELTPYFLELEEIAGLNFGGGNAQIDLETGVFDWAQ